LLLIYFGAAAEMLANTCLQLAIFGNSSTDVDWSIEVDEFHLKESRLYWQV
jgi:hypothetical protein